MNRRFFGILIVSCMLAIGINGCNDDTNTNTTQTPAKPEVGTQISISLVESTDLHTNVLSYDYYKTAEDKTVGLERAATIIKQLRQENPNTLLLDNGDTIQGTALGDYQAGVNPVKCDETLATFKAMNYLKYDAMVVGNHEFNYGLEFLSQVTHNGNWNSKYANCKGPSFPVISANVYKTSDKKPLYAPYVILDKVFNGHKVKVGVIGFTPPQIMMWDKKWLDGKVYVEGVKESAQKYIPEMRSKGADIVVAMVHGGIDNRPYSATMESAAYYVADVPGVDAIFMGHSHRSFPNNKDYSGIDGVDNAKGTIKGIPAVMAGFWGNTVGLITLDIKWDGQKWSKATSSSKLIPITTTDANGANVYTVADPEIAKLVQAEHEATIKYVQTPVGTSDYRIASQFTQSGSPAVVQIINDAQLEHMKDVISKGYPQYSSLPLLSAAAPFKMNYNNTGYTDIAAGGVAIKNVADMYIYPNTLQAVKITGANVKSWLERSAEYFNAINATKTEDQELINSKFASYNFDVIQGSGISYQIDITKPVGSRIVNLNLNGMPLDANQEVIVVTNNYRASGGGSFAGLNGSQIIYEDPDTNREIIVNYIKAKKQLTRNQNGANRNWSFVKQTVTGNVLFQSAYDSLQLAIDDGVTNIVKHSDKSDKSASIYKLLLDK